MRERGRATGRARERKIERAENEGRGGLARRVDRPVVTRDTPPPARSGRRDEEEARDRTRSRRPRRIAARSRDESARGESARDAAKEQPAPGRRARARTSTRGARTPRTRRPEGPEGAG